MSRRLNGSNLEVLRPQPLVPLDQWVRKKEELLDLKTTKTLANPRQPRVTEKAKNEKQVVFCVLEGKIQGWFSGVFWVLV